MLVDIILGDVHRTPLFFPAGGGGELSEGEGNVKEEGGRGREGGEVVELFSQRGSKETPLGPLG